MTVPGQGAFSYLRTGRTIETQAAWIWGLRRGCQVCHQMGNKATRDIEPEIRPQKLVPEKAMPGEERTRIETSPVQQPHQRPEIDGGSRRHELKLSGMKLDGGA